MRSVAAWLLLGDHDERNKKDGDQRQSAQMVYCYLGVRACVR